MKIDLPPVEFGPLSLRAPMTTVRLVDGPCAGAWIEVPEGRECWQRVGKPGGVSVETQMWACYQPAMPGGYAYTGMTVTTDQLQAALDAAAADGHTHGESYGA